MFLFLNRGVNNLGKVKTRERHPTKNTGPLPGADTLGEPATSSDYRYRQEMMGVFFSSGSLGIMTANQERVIYSNDAFLRIVGYSQRDLRQGRVDWPALTPGEYAHLDERAWRELLEQGVCTPYEKVLIRKDGERVPVLMGATLARYRPPQLVGFVLDETSCRTVENRFEREQRRLKEMVIQRTSELGEEKRRTADILDKVSEAVFILDREWRITYINQVAEMMFLIKRERLQGRNFWEVIPEGLGGLFGDTLHRSLRENRPALIEAYSRDINRYVRVRGYPSGDGISLFFNTVPSADHGGCC